MKYNVPMAVDTHITVCTGTLAVDTHITVCTGTRCREVQVDLFLRNTDLFILNCKTSHPTACNLGVSHEGT
jgi:hypothetical protein